MATAKQLRESGLTGSISGAPAPTGLGTPSGDIQKFSFERTASEEMRGALLESLTPETRERIRRGESVPVTIQKDAPLTTEVVKETAPPEVTQEQIKEAQQIERKKAQEETIDVMTKAGISPEALAEHTDIKRKKSIGETVDVTTDLEKPTIPLSKTIPKETEEDKFKGKEIITKEEARKSRKKALEVDWNNPVESADAFITGWREETAFREQEVLREIERKREKQAKATREIYSLTGSTETISPEQYQKEIGERSDIIITHGVTPKEGFILVTAPAVFGVARGSQNVAEAFLHPVRTLGDVATAVVTPQETAKAIGQKFLEDPIGTIAEVGTEAVITAKGTKAVMRVVQPKVVEIPVKAKEIRVLETKRETPEGKVATDTQIQIDTVEGKPKERFFFEKRKTKVREEIPVELERTTRQKIEGVTRVESTGKVKGKLKLKEEGKKAKIEVKEFEETTPPETILDLETPQRGMFKARPEGEFKILEPVAKVEPKLPSGTPITGKTPKLMDAPKVEVIKKTRKGYQYKKKDLVDGVYSDGDFLVVIRKGKVVKVPPKVLQLSEVSKPETFRTKAPPEGTLLSEAQSVGKFVKRKYEKKTKMFKAKAPDVIKTKPEFEVTLDSQGMVKKVKDLRDFQILESGKVVKLGKKPLTPSQEKMLSRLDTEQKTVLETITEKPKVTKTKTKTTEPVIRVIEKGAEVKGVSIFAPDTKTKEKVLTVLETKGVQEEKFFSDIGEKFKPDIGVKERQEADQKPKPLTKTKTFLDTDTIPEQDVKPVLDVREKPLTEQKVIPVAGTEFKSGTGFGFEEAKPVPEVPLITTPSPLDSEANEKKKEMGYNTYMIEEGKKVKANLKPLPMREADRLGRDIADNSVSASYKVSRTKHNVPSSRRSKMALGSYANKDKFTESKSKKRKGFKIEKRASRIDTAGEKSGLKASRVIADRKKSVSKMAKLFGGSGKKSKSSSPFGKSKSFFGFGKSKKLKL